MMTVAERARRWALEDLFTDGARGRAEADARFYGNASARAALRDLDAAVRYLASVTSRSRLGDSGQEP